MDLILHNMTIVWVVAIIVFVVLEATTQGLVSIWFAGGALVACIAGLLHLGLWTQIAVFLVVSIILILLTKPLQRKLADRLQKTNVDAVIGRNGIVEEEIPPEQTGRVRLDGKIWTAKSESNEPIPAGTHVTVTAIEGVTITVMKER